MKSAAVETLRRFSLCRRVSFNQTLFGESGSADLPQEPTTQAPDLREQRPPPHLRGHGSDQRWQPYKLAKKCYADSAYAEAREFARKFPVANCSFSKASSSKHYSRSRLLTTHRHQTAKRQFDDTIANKVALVTGAHRDRTGDSAATPGRGSTGVHRAATDQRCLRSD